MAVSVQWGSFVWVSLRIEAPYLGSMIGRLIFEISQSSREAYPQALP